MQVKKGDKMNDEDTIKFWQQGLKQSYCTEEYAKLCRSEIWKLKKEVKRMKILNLYAGIGGNRKLWPKEHKVTAIENNKDIAAIYQDLFPKRPGHSYRCS